MRAALGSGCCGCHRLLQMQTDYQALLAEATANPGKPATHFEALTGLPATPGRY